MKARATIWVLVGTLCMCSLYGVLEKTEDNTIVWRTELYKALCTTINPILLYVPNKPNFREIDYNLRKFKRNKKVACKQPSVKDAA